MNKMSNVGLMYEARFRGSSDETLPRHGRVMDGGGGGSRARPTARRLTGAR